MGSRSSRSYYDDCDSGCSDCEDHVNCDCGKRSGERRRERYEDADPDEYAMVPVKGRRGYEEAPSRAVERRAAPPTQEPQEREMSTLKVEEQKIKNKIATERLAFDVQKRQQSKELHDIKLLLLKKYPNILFNANKHAVTEA